MGNSKRAKRTVAIALTATLLLSSFSGISHAAEKGDISNTAGHTEEQAILSVVEAGWLELEEDGAFHPDQAITREEFAHLLNQALGLKDKSILYFGDLDEAEYYDDIAIAVRAGYMRGGDGNVFLPAEAISHEEAAVILARLLPAKEPLFQAAIPDGSEVAPWARDAVAMAVNSGYMGVPFFPKAEMTRAEAAQLVTALMAREVIQSGNLNLQNRQTIKDTIIAGNVYAETGVSKVALDNCVVLGNTYLDGEKVEAAFSGRTRVLEAKGNLTLTVSAGSQIEYLYTWGDKNTVKIEGAVGTVVANGPTALTGSGTVSLLRANSDDVASSMMPERITVGDFTKKAPIIAGKGYVSSTAPAVSPDREKIVRDAAAMPEIKELPYDAGVTYHTDIVEGSHAFSSMYCSVGSVSLEDNKYVEKEFLMSGKANVYNLYDNDTPYIVKADNPYATRLLVRYPNDGKKFSGRVYIDILNASSGIDLEDIWRRSYQYFMDNGDVYIGITSQSDVAAALKRFDEVRYADINWQVDGKNEDGLFWDMLSQLGNMLRDHPEAILPASMKPERVYVSGQSWSGDYLNTYSSVFYSYYNCGRSLFDGYVSVVSPAETFIASGVAGPVHSYTETKEPYIVIMSEGERYFGAYDSWYLDFEYLRGADANEENHKFRFYEVAGSGHSDPVSPIIPNNGEIAKANKGNIRAPKVYTGDERPSDLQLDMIITGALENEHLWATEGIPAPSGEAYWLEYRTVVDPDPYIGDLYENVRDANGNALGGIRMPQIEVPVATYKPFRNDASLTDGSMTYFSAEQIKELYPKGYAQYKEKFDAQAKKLLDEGFIIQSDYKKLIAEDWNKDLF